MKYRLLGVKQPFGSPITGYNVYLMWEKVVVGNVVLQEEQEDGSWKDIPLLVVEDTSGHAN